MFERRILNISIEPVVQRIEADDDCTAVTCGYCSGGCTNCTTSCRGAASTKILFLGDRREEVELNVAEIVQILSHKDVSRDIGRERGE